MRFKKGSKVEVLTQKDVPSGSWRCAEIIGGNGHNYTVRYEGDVMSFVETMVETVPRKAIRPCPPSVEVTGDWVPGDVVEVFHNYSWKMATVLMVSRWTHLLVRLLGSAIELKTHKYDVRARLCWQDGEWIVIGKASNMYEDTRFRVPSSRKRMDSTASRHFKGDFVSMGNTNGVAESRRIPCRAPKRKLSECHYQIEVYAGQSQKIRVGEERRLQRQINVLRLRRLPEKVDDVACSQEVLGEKCIHPSFMNKITRCSEMILEREKRDGDGGAVGFSRSISLETGDDDSVSSSIGSCSVYRSHSHKLHHVFAAGPFRDNDSECSDAESFCQLRFEEGNCHLPAKEKLKEEIHRLELHAYRCTIEALHASGPLSWEQELLLTNLRDSLHISNDEHLREIRNLVSPSACIPSS